MMLQVMIVDDHDDAAVADDVDDDNAVDVADDVGDDDVDVVDVCHLATDLRVMPMAWLGPPVTTPSLKIEIEIVVYHGR